MTDTLKLGPLPTGRKLAVTHRKTNTSKTVAVTVNKSDVVELVGAPAPVPPDPPPVVVAPPVVATGERVVLGDETFDGPNWDKASIPLQYRWVKGGGDYLDSKGVQNGPDHWATLALDDAFKKDASGFTPFEVGALVEKLRADNTGFLLSTTGGYRPAIGSRFSATPPKLRVVTTTGTFDPPCILNTYVDPSFNGGVGDGPTVAFHGGMLKFNLSAITGTVKSAQLRVTWVANYVLGLLFHVDFLDMPRLITDPARQLGGVEGGIAATVAKDTDLATHPAILFYPPWDSLTAINAAWTAANITFIPITIVDWPEYGLKAARLESHSLTPDTRSKDGDGSTLIAWREYLVLAGLAGTPKVVGTKKYAQLHLRYMLRVDPDAYLAATTGVKLPGLEGTGFSTRMEHHLKSKCNPNVFRLFAYSYDAAADPTNSFIPGNAGALFTSVCLRTGQIYCIELRIKLNTKTGDGPAAWNADGALEIWVDGVKVFSDTRRMMNTSDYPAFVSHIFFNVYHGGLDTPLYPMHYEVGGVALSENYIGPARQLSAPVVALPPPVIIVPPPGPVVIVPPPPVIVPSGKPKYLQGKPVGVPFNIPGSSLSALLGPDGIQLIDLWTGLAVGPGTFTSAANGGHSSEPSNSVHMIDVRQDDPKWFTLFAGSKAADIPTVEEMMGPPILNKYRDGRPPSDHSYYALVHIVARNRIMRPFIQAGWGNPISFPQMDAYSIADGDWDAVSKWPDYPCALRPVMAVCKHPITEDIYASGWNQRAVWRQADGPLGRWEKDWPAPNGFGPWFAPSFIDLTRNSIVYLYRGVIVRVNLTTGVRTDTPTGLVEDTNAHSASAHDVKNDRYYHLNSRPAHLIRIHPDTGAVENTWELPDASNGVHNRFAHFPELGALYVYPHYTTEIICIPTE